MSGFNIFQHIQGYTTQPSQHSWVYQANRELEILATKLVSSIQELWTPAQDLA